MHGQQNIKTLYLGHKIQSVNDAEGRRYCFSWEPHKTHKCNVITMQNFLMLYLVVCIVTARL